MFLTSPPCPNVVHGARPDLVHGRGSNRFGSIAPSRREQEGRRHSGRRERRGNVGRSTPARRFARVGKVRTRPGESAGTGAIRLTSAPAILAVEPVAKSLAGLEGRHGARRDGNGFAGLGIAALPWRAVGGGELAEPRDVDGLAPFECGGDGRDDGVARGGGIGPGQRRAGGDARAELRAVHGFSPVCVAASMFDDACGPVEGRAGSGPSMAGRGKERAGDPAHRRGRGCYVVRRRFSPGACREPYRGGETGVSVGDERHADPDAARRSRARPVSRGAAGRRRGPQRERGRHRRGRARRCRRDCGARCRGREDASFAVKYSPGVRDLPDVAPSARGRRGGPGDAAPRARPAFVLTEVRPARPQCGGGRSGLDIDGGQGRRGRGTVLGVAARDAEPGMTTAAQRRDPERAWSRLRANPDYVADWRASAGATVREAPPYAFRRQSEADLEAARWSLLAWEDPRHPQWAELFRARRDDGRGAGRGARGAGMAPPAAPGRCDVHGSAAARRRVGAQGVAGPRDRADQGCSTAPPSTRRAAASRSRRAAAGVRAAFGRGSRAWTGSWALAEGARSRG